MSVELRQRRTNHKTQPNRPIHDIYFEGKRVGRIDFGKKSCIALFKRLPPVAIKEIQKAVTDRDGTTEPRTIIMPPSLRG